MTPPQKLFFVMTFLHFLENVMMVDGDFDSYAILLSLSYRFDMFQKFIRLS